MDPKWTPKLQNVRKLCSQKNDKKTYRQHVVKRIKIVSKWGGAFDAGDVPKIIKNLKFAKMDPRDVPGSKRHPKGIQKAPKRHPKGIQKASKRYPKGVQKASKKHPN